MEQILSQLAFIEPSSVPRTVINTLNALSRLNTHYYSKRYASTLNLALGDTVQAPGESRFGRHTASLPIPAPPYWQVTKPLYASYSNNGCNSIYSYDCYEE